MQPEARRWNPSGGPGVPLKAGKIIRVKQKRLRRLINGFRIKKLRRNVKVYHRERNGQYTTQ